MNSHLDNSSIQTYKPRKTTRSRSLFWGVIFSFFSLCSAFTAVAQNPVLPGYQADPEIRLFNGKYYIYPTGGNRFHAYSSNDLTNWVDEGVIFDLGPQCNWADTDGWAPSVVYRNGHYEVVRLRWTV